MVDVVATFIFFFAVIDPIGTVPVFLAVTRHQDARGRQRIAVTAALAAAAVLVFFVVAGEILLGAMEIPLSAFQIAGGLVLFLFAQTMIFGESKPEEEVRLAGGGRDTAIYPLAIPSIAGPGAMLAAVLQTENARFTILEQAQVTAIILVVVLIALLLMLAASWVHRVIGDSGASIISRVMGLVLASVAVASVLGGIDQYFGLSDAGERTRIERDAATWRSPGAQASSPEGSPVARGTGRALAGDPRPRSGRSGAPRRSS